jgi:putative solute:sodium symporter small subunit
VSRASRRAHAYWQANLRVLGLLLTVWLVAGYLLGIVLVEPLNTIRIGGFPLGFWFAQQGAIVVFVALIVVYAVWMDAIERRMAADVAAEVGRAGAGNTGGSGNAGATGKAAR